MTKWQEVKLGDVCSSISETYHNKDAFVVLVNTSDVLEGKILNHELVKNEKLKGQFKKTFKKDDILYSEIRPANKRFAYVNFDDTSNYIASTKLMVLRPNKEKILPKFLFNILKSEDIISELQHLAETRSGTFPQITFSSELAPMEILLPPLEIQKKIAGVLSAFDDKIELNNKINNNLEQQAQALFNEMFLDDISNVHSRHHLLLSELVQNIDNRGKTPPLSPEKTDFPIIDVKALSGNTRIINYDNCTKFVSQETYLTGFRSGLPKKYDILLSTVGSLGEIKLFIEPKGCIAQNVIGYRSKISPLYIYQYLRTIRNDLLAYDIGSVQPSIKVTHIAKHPIFIPNEDKLKEFHSIAETITNKIYVNSQENIRLAAIRDALLPKLMSGEIDVSNVDISALTSTDKLSFTEE